ncbi:BTB/POZ domain-containing protein [Tanacetum coccineum]
MGLMVVAERAAVRLNAKSLPRKVNIEFGEVGTGDLRVVLLGRQGFIVKLSVHKSVVKENSTFFAEKLLAQHPIFHCIEVDDCEDVETYDSRVQLIFLRFELFLVKFKYETTFDLNIFLIPVQSSRNLAEDQVKSVMSDEHTQTLEDTYDIYLLSPGADSETYESYLRIRNREGRYSLMFEHDSSMKDIAHCIN